MRITSLEIENFRCFGTRTRVDFAPITLLFGANSVGKSSILGALDLMRVLMSEVNPSITEDRCVGTLADVGGFQSMVHDHNVDRVIRIRLLVDLSGATTEHDLDDEDAPLVTEAARDPLEGVDDELEEVWVECALTWSHVRRRAWVSSFIVGTVGQSESLVEIQSPGDHRHRSQISVWLQHPLLNPEPDEDGLTEIERALEEAALADHRRFQTDSPMPVFRHALPLFGIDSAVPHRAHSPRFSTGSMSGPISPAVRSIRQLLHRTVMGIADRVREALAGVVRIGPLRLVPPRTHLPRPHTTTGDWFDGLAAWDLLHTGAPQTVQSVASWMVRIGTGCDIERITEYTYNSPVGASINLAYEVAGDVAAITDLDAESEQDECTMVSVTLENEFARAVLWETRNVSDPVRRERVVLHPEGGSLVLHPTEVGTGISQVLPVVTASVHFSSEKSAFVAMEQPELHVHPRIQLGLGDLFIDAVTREGASNCTFLIETHSEHLMLRLLRRIRETSDDESARLQPSTVAVWTLHRTDGGVAAQRVGIDAEGEFTESWPEGFFHERGGELF